MNEKEQNAADWDLLAQDWDIQVGDEGDNNRRINSDPVLWQFLGNVEGQRVLDAGCGTGYLSRKLAAAGALITGIDISPKMVEIARRKGPDMDFHVDSCSELATQPDSFFDALVANYVLMDVPDYEGAVRAFHRVLRPGGLAVLVFSHPCFPAGKSTLKENKEAVAYYWTSGYFDAERRVDPPWNHFKHDFVWYHRPLSDYWKVFKAAGFTVEDFEEPRVTPDRYHLISDARQLKKSQTCPFSVAFKIRKA